jgi:hypothetical protein
MLAGCLSPDRMPLINASPSVFCESRPPSLRVLARNATLTSPSLRRKKANVLDSFDDRACLANVEPERAYERAHPMQRDLAWPLSRPLCGSMAHSPNSRLYGSKEGIKPFDDGRMGEYRVAQRSRRHFCDHEMPARYAAILEARGLCLGGNSLKL